MKRLTEFFSLTCPRRPAEWVSCDLINGRWGKRTGSIPFDRSSNPELANVPADMLVHVVKQKGEEAPPRSLPPVERTSVDWLFHRELARVLVHADDRAVVVTPTVVVDPEEQCLYDSHCVVEFTHAIQGARETSCSRAWNAIPCPWPAVRSSSGIPTGSSSYMKR